MNHPPRRGALLLVGWAVASTLVGRSFTALDPDPSDAQLFAYIGLKWAQGYIPYVDIWDHKPPGIFAVNVLASLLFPKSFTALACLEGLFILGCIATVYGLVRRWRLPWPATAVATAAAASATNLALYNEHGNFPEVYLLWPATLSMYCFARAAPAFQGRWIVLAGVCAGVAALFKPTGLAPFLAQAAWMFLLWTVGRALSGRQLLTSFLANGTGVLAVWLLTALYFWQYSAVWELVHASVLYNVHYGLASQAGGWQVLLIPFTLASNLLPLSSLVVCALAGLVFAMGRERALWRKPDVATTGGWAMGVWWPLVLLWVGADVAGAMAGGRYYRHYFLPLVPSLAVAAGLLCGYLMEVMPKEPRARGGNRVFCALVLAPLVFAQASDVGHVLRRTLLPGARPGTSAWQAVATHLNAIRGPGDTLFTWDYFPGIYLATEMHSPARHLDTHNIFDFPAAHQQYGEEILRSLWRNPPTFIVEGWTTPSDAPLRMRDPAYLRFRAWRQDHYVLTYTADDLQVYIHRSQRGMPSQ